MEKWGVKGTPPSEGTGGDAATSPAPLPLLTTKAGRPGLKRSLFGGGGTEAGAGMRKEKPDMETSVRLSGGFGCPRRWERRGWSGRSARSAWRPGKKRASRGRSSAATGGGKFIGGLVLGGATCCVRKRSSKSPGAGSGAGTCGVGGAGTCGVGAPVKSGGGGNGSIWLLWRLRAGCFCCDDVRGLFGGGCGGRCTCIGAVVDNGKFGCNGTCCPPRCPREPRGWAVACCCCGWAVAVVS
mmetsp:Transcript_13940/g.42161  ORF Transcript_13940/g.42161 Transcript_13940/m.42161 type:complete len:240 (-) Transcript_13940:1044-1763(-)